MYCFNSTAKSLALTLTLACCALPAPAQQTSASIAPQVLDSFKKPLQSSLTTAAIRSLAPATSTSATVGTQTDAFAFAQKIDEYIRAAMLLHSMPGISVAVVTDGELVYSNGYGLANQHQDIAVTSETLFNLASVSKSITAVATMQLVERGKLNLSSPIQAYVPEFPEKEWPVTCHDLLCHLAGIRHYQGSEGISSDHSDDVVASLKIFKDDPLLHEPGSTYSYSSYGYNLLGAAVQRASGTSFTEYVQKEIFQPSGALNVRVYDGTVDAPVQAIGYLKDKEGLVNTPKYDATSKIPSAGFLASAVDIARFAAALLSEKLVSTETLNAMIQPQSLASGKKTSYGLGWMSGFWGRTPIASHAGTAPGFTSLLYMIPERKFAVVLLTNISGSNLNELLYRIRDEVLKPGN